MSKYFVRTLGCKANLYDSQLIEAELQKRGWKPSDSGAASLCIVNSCTVTDEADRQSRKLAARMSRENPSAAVVVTGCAAEVDPERIASSKGIHYVIGNQDKPRLVDLILAKLGETLPEHGQVIGGVEGYSEIISRHPMDREWPMPGNSFSTPPVELEEQKMTRAFLKIQEGCNSFCTYCIIPYGRGPSRSLAAQEIVRQVNELVDQGVHEIIITGTNIGDYGTDWSDSAGKPQLEDLLKRILGETRIQRIRVSSLDPTEITSGIMRLMESEPRLCPHFHVSLQSPHSRLLRLMKRRYGFEQVKACLEAVASIRTKLPGGVFVGMDVITGFPGETREEFDWGAARLSELPWTRLHVFPFSERAGTPATRLPDPVPQEERVRRSRVLQRLSLERMRARHQGLLATGPLELSSVLIESGTSEFWSGYTPNYLRVLLPKAASVVRNSIIGVRVGELRAHETSGEVSFLALTS